MGSTSVEPDPEMGYPTSGHAVDSVSNTPFSTSVTTLAPLEEAHVAQEPKNSKEASVSVSVYPSGADLADSAATLAVDGQMAAAAAEEKVSPKTTSDKLGCVAWAQIIAGFLLSSVAWGMLSMFGVYQLYYTQTCGLPVSRVSWVGSVQTFLAYLVSTASGQLSDRGKARTTMVAGSLFIAGGGIYHSFASSSVQHLLLSQGMLTGIGLGLVSAPAVSSIQQHVPERHHTVALALTTVGTSFGGALFPVVVQQLLERPAVGFAWAVRCQTAVAVVFCAVALALLRPVVVEKKKNEAEDEKKSADTKQQLVATKETTIKKKILKILDYVVDPSAFCEPPFVLFLVCAAFLFWGLYFGFNYVTVYAEAVSGMSSNQATTLLVVATALGIPSRPVAGLMADRLLGAWNTLILSCVFAAAVLLGWIAVGASTAGIWVFAVLFGLANGLIQGVWLGVLSAVTPSSSSSSSSSSSRIGVRFGMVNTVCALATLAGPPTAAALIKTAPNGSNTSNPVDYQKAMVWAAATTLVGGLVAVVARVRASGWRLCKA